MLESHPLKYSVGHIMSRTSILYCKILEMKVLNKDEVLDIIRDEIHEIDSELKKISEYLEKEKEGAEC